MKIAILNHSFPPDVGGGESQIYTISKKLQEYGHIIEVFTGTNPKNKNPFIVNYIDGFKEFERGAIGVAPFLKELKDLLAYKDFDIIFCSNFSSLLAVSFLNGLIKGKIIFTFHCGISPELNKVVGLFGDWDLEVCFASNIIKNSTPVKVICPSEHFKDWAVKFGVKDEDTSVVYNSVDLALFESVSVTEQERIRMRRQNNFPQNAFVFITPARMYEKKGILDLVRAIGKIKSQGYFLIVSSLIKGSHDFSKIVENEIINLGINDRIKIIYDSYSVHDMPYLYKQCDSFILPSHTEMLPVSILEAMASGIPIVCSDLIPVREVVINNINGLTFKVKDTRDLADIIDKMVQLSNEQRNFLIKNAYNTIRNKFNADIEIKKLERVFLEVLSDEDE